jgi:hypothetical protein
VKPQESKLAAAFVEDHRRFVRGLRDVLEALRSAELGRARQLAEALDRDVGAHILFEEEHFYPLLEGRLGSGRVERLFDEHERGRRAVARLLSLSEDARLEPEELGQLVDDLEVALQHAVGCGSMLSTTEGLSEGEQRVLVEHLLAARERAPRWTEVGARRPLGR